MRGEAGRRHAGDPANLEGLNFADSLKKLTIDNEAESNAGIEQGVLKLTWKIDSRFEKCFRQEFCGSPEIV